MVSAFEPTWVADSMRWIVAIVATPVLFWAATTAMLGVSRHIYTLAINRQIPSWLGKLNARHATPHIAIAISGLIAIGLVIPTNVKLLAGIYAFGATLAITIAHLSILRLRVTEPDRARPFRVPWNVDWNGSSIPIPVVIAAVLTGLAFLSVLAFHDTARWVGLGWMAFGLFCYVVYRKVVEGTTLTQRVSVTERALTKKMPRDLLPQHPRPGLRDRPRRRHRLDRGPPRRRHRRGVGRPRRAEPGSRSSTWSRCR